MDFGNPGSIVQIPEREMDVSENSGTPKLSILIGFSILGYPYFLKHPDDCVRSRQNTVPWHYMMMVRASWSPNPSYSYTQLRVINTTPIHPILFRKSNARVKKNSNLPWLNYFNGRPTPAKNCCMMQSARISQDQPGNHLEFTCLFSWKMKVYPP